MTDTRPPRSPEAALAIPVPEVDNLIGPFRALYDPSAAAGVPAHITINFPFTPHFSRPDEARRGLSRLIANRAAFRYTLAEIRTFPNVIYLSPHPAEPFVDLIHDIVDQFPDSPAYGGAFETVIPHVTIAQSDDPAVLRRVLAELEAAVAPHLPVACTAKRILLLDNAGGRWDTRATFDLHAT